MRCHADSAVTKHCSFKFKHSELTAEMKRFCHAITSVPHTSYLSGATYWTTLSIAPANISLLNDVFAWFIVPLTAAGRFQVITLMY
jgi:hypothetical protein